MPTDTIDRVEAGVLVQPGPRGAPLLVAFGGVAAGLGIPPFEFMRLTGELPVGRVFLRDLRQAWFQKGIADVGPRPADIAARLQALIDDLEPSRVVFTGNSAGAYAALLFGTMLRPDEVHAFAPQTFISWPKRLAHRDLRWTREQIRMRVGGLERRYLDLVPVLTSHDGTAAMHVYYATSDRLDALHARRLSRTGVQLHGFEAGGHGLVRALRDSGDLQRIIRAAVA